MAKIFPEEPARRAPVNAARGEVNERIARVVKIALHPRGLASLKPGEAAEIRRDPVTQKMLTFAVKARGRAGAADPEQMEKSLLEKFYRK